MHYVIAKTPIWDKIVVDNDKIMVANKVDLRLTLIS